MQDDENQEELIEVGLDELPPPPKKKKLRDTQALLHSVKVLEDVRNERKQRSEKPKTEFVVFGELVAKQLSGMKKTTAIKVQLEIQQLTLTARLKDSEAE